MNLDIKLQWWNILNRKEMSYLLPGNYKNVLATQKKIPVISTLYS